MQKSANPLIEGSETVPSDANTEHHLLRLAQSGDKEAFTALHLLLQAPAQAFTRRLIGEVDEDIVQDSFLALYMNLERLEPPEKLRPFRLYSKCFVTYNKRQL